jgi:RNA polymerase sigma-70 factor (ECF subfamily)
VRAIRGDRVALERLLLAQYTRLWQHITSKLKGRLAALLSADDIVQETFVQAIRDIHNCESRTERSFAAWLNTIADHRLLDIARKLNRKKRGGGIAEAHGPVGDTSDSMAELVEMLSTGGRTPSQSAARHEAIQAIQVAIAALPDDQREAVRLHHLDGKSIDETAVVMGRTPGAVRGLLQRARRALRDALVRSTLWLSRR